MRTLLASLVFFVAMPSSGCSLGGLEFDPAFEPRAARLSGAEMLRLARWRSDLRIRFPNMGEFYVEVQASNAAGVPGRLAESRRKHLMESLQNLGIARADIQVSKVVERSVDRGDLARADLHQKVIRYINTAAIAIDPKCPHACCLGPQPIR